MSVWRLFAYSWVVMTLVFAVVLGNTTTINPWGAVVIGSVPGLACAFAFAVDYGGGSASVVQPYQFPVIND